jgi:hypothetical protein
MVQRNPNLKSLTYILPFLFIYLKKPDPAMLGEKNYNVRVCVCVYWISAVDGIVLIELIWSKKK